MCSTGLEKEPPCPAGPLGEINVQVILERLGGGGNSTTAGGHVPGSEPETVYQRLIAAIDAYYQ